MYADLSVPIIGDGKKPSDIFNTVLNRVIHNG